MRTTTLLLLVLVALFAEGSAFLNLFRPFKFGWKGGQVKEAQKTQNLPSDQGVKVDVDIKKEQKGKEVQQSQVQQSQESSSDYDTGILYPFGDAVGDKKTPQEDDGTSGEVPLSEEYKFFGKSYKSLYVNNNGVISFNTAVSQYTPDAFPLTDGQVFVTPFWADVDVELGGTVYYRETRDPALLERITTDMKKHLPELSFEATWAFIATWHDVVFYGAAVKKRNTFQAVLTTDGMKYLAILNYKDIQWATGTASEGDANTGKGGVPAQAGFNSGDNVNYFSVPGSRTNEILRIQYTTNVDYLGRWVFLVDKFEVPGGCTFEAKFANEGEVFYKEPCCKSKCVCKNGKVTCTDDACPKAGTCEELGSFYTCKMPKKCH
ncbi:alpha-tectorin-like [Gastrophryne carolinensis]